MRRYHGFMADSDRWRRFPLRDDDVIISTPSKCGTTWMQTIVGMLLLGRVDLGRPLGQLSPWLDMLTRTEDEVFSLLEAQQHRRFIKTHTALDGLPRHPAVTYLCVVRHPLDVAMSDWDHRENMDVAQAAALRHAVVRAEGRPALEPIARPGALHDYLHWWIHDDQAPTGSTINLAELAHQAVTYWTARHEPGVHLFHYADLQRDRDGQMRRVAGALGVPVDERRWPAFVEAAGLDAMRGRADRLAPDAHLGMWRSDERFFRQGGHRAWDGVLSPDEIEAYEARIVELAGPEVASWLHTGRHDAA